MKTSRKLKLQSLVLLVSILFQVVYPTTAYAIADGPLQPEYESFEDFNATDMVNLITGDFTYNIPLLSVPSPEGGFQIPLSYHAGIQLNEEASWVGLGWAINPGAITRKVSCFPDDFNGQQVSTDVSNPGGSGYVWTKYDGITAHYYDSNKGLKSYSSAAFFHGDSDGNLGISFFGLDVDINTGKMTFDATKMATQIVTSAAGAMVGRFGRSFGSNGGTIGSALYMTASLKASLGGAQETGTHFKGQWATEISSYSSNFLGTSTSYNYKYYMKMNATNAHYGTLYLGDMPYTDKGVTTDVKVFNDNTGATSSDPDGNFGRRYKGGVMTSAVTPASDMWINTNDNYAKEYNPTHLAYDSYSVKGQGIGGVIKPYREDFGSLSNPILEPIYHDCLIGPRFLAKSDYKVQFKYEGDYSNSYTNHNTSGNLNSKPFPFTIDDTQNSNPEHLPLVEIEDPKAYGDYEACTGSGCSPTGAYNTYYSLSAKTEGNRAGRHQNKLAHKKHIEWYTNFEIGSGAAALKGFMNTHQGYDRNYSTGRYVIAEHIGGFSITNENGLTFHYSIPVYNKGEAFLAKEGSTTFKRSDGNWYASAWLLTGITGPDFVDRGSVGIIDQEDWGYWVKFDYGQFSTDYHWRSPYFGFQAGQSCRIGKMETYYLNNISTRSHTAMFVKSLRTDGKSYYESDGLYNLTNYAVTGPGGSVKPSSSLKLDDIYILENSDYQTLTSSGGLNATMNKSGASDGTIKNGDTFDKVWDTGDLNSASMHLFIDENQLERIHFDYDYRLCNKTYNSFNFDGSGNAPTYDANTTPANTSVYSGKLTLASVQVRGKYDERLMPDYVFTYGDPATYGQTGGDNPDYDPIKWDGYGMYKQGQLTYGFTGNCEYGHNSEKKADQWCLTSILTPMGSKIKVEYERDTYDEVNGSPINPNSPLRIRKTTHNVQVLTAPPWSTFSHIGVCYDNFGAQANLLDYFDVGNEIYVWNFGTSTYQPVGNVASTSGNKIYVNNYTNQSVNADEMLIVAAKKYGGDLRVKTIKVEDDDGVYTTRYAYTENGLENGQTSGVASYEPEFDRPMGKGDFSFYKEFEHPFGPVLYSNVAVITGKLGDPIYKESQRSTYHFVTPKSTMISRSQDMVKGDGFCHIQAVGNAPGDAISWSTGWGTFNTVVNTAAIGNMDTMKTYNQFNNLESKTVYEYTNNDGNEYANNMGSYTENNLLWEIIQDGEKAGPHSPTPKKIKMMQSYKIKKPSILKSVTTYKDRLVSKKEILSYDYLTGEPLLTKSIYGNIEKYENEIVPAYTKYSALGSKIYDPKNKNIMTAPAESYAYVYDKNNVRKLLSASVNTWANNHNYRSYNSGTGSYQNQQYTSNTSPYQTTWLPFQSYSWKSLVEENGTLKSAPNVEKFVDFDWTLSAIDNHWKKNAEITLYDHFSHALESKDIGNRPSSTKTGYSHSYAIGSCTNARYNAWCYSGAEDKSADGNYFSGEVEGSNTQMYLPTFSHTGDFCSSITASGQKGFVFKINKNDMPVTDKYRASVWVHKSGVNGARLYCKAGFSYLATAQVAAPASGIVEQAGDWYLFSLELPVSSLAANTLLEFGVDNISATTMNVITDDFRVHPINAPFASNIYDPKTGKIIATLNQDNYATKYSYDNQGRLRVVYKETRNGFSKAMEKNHNYARQ